MALPWALMIFYVLLKINKALLHLSTTPVHDDAVLLRQVASGDESAFNTLFERYRNKLYHYMLGVTKSPEISEEIVMDVFVKLWVGRELLSDIRQLDRFLHKVAYHKAVDFLRAASRQARLQQAYIARIDPEPEKPADALLIDAETRQLLLDAIRQLPPQRKLIYQLSREEGLTHEQIAEALNLSRSTVKNSIVSATKSISAYLRKNNTGKTGLSMLFFLS